MRKGFLQFGAIVALVCGISFAYAQKATERFIPIGQSPGLSGKYTYVGKIQAVDSARRTIKVAQPGSRTVRITNETRIWLDRSKLKQPNETGAFADLRQGRTVEIKYKYPTRKHAAEWVKVEITTP